MHDLFAESPDEEKILHQFYINLYSFYPKVKALGKGDEGGVRLMNFTSRFPLLRDSTFQVWP